MQCTSHFEDKALLAVTHRVQPSFLPSSNKSAFVLFHTCRRQQQRGKLGPQNVEPALMELDYKQDEGVVALLHCPASEHSYFSSYALVTLSFFSCPLLALQLQPGDAPGAGGSLQGIQMNSRTHGCSRLCCRVASSCGLQTRICYWGSG